MPTIASSPPRPPRRRGVVLALHLAAATALFAGCAAKPVPAEKIVQLQMEHRPPPPQPLFSDMDHTLACLGDQLREQKIQPLLIGYSAVTDTSGKTGVDFAAVMRSALSKVVARGNNLGITAMGFGPSARPEQASVEERNILRDPASAARLLRPDWLITGGGVSTTTSFVSIQTSGGLSARDLDLARSSTSGVDLVSMSFGVKWADTGVDLPMRTVDVRVSYQLLSSAAEAGVFAQATVNGRPLAAGLRLGRTVAVAQVPEDAVRVGVEWAVLQILSGRYNVDLSACPQHVLTADAQLPKAEQLPAPGALPGLWQAMSASERVQWFQGRLAARGYLAGAADGKLGARTREALTRAAQDAGLPATGQASDALYYVMATRELAFGRDPRKPAVPDPAAAQRIHVQLNQPNAPYVAGVYLRATVLAPTAGYMHCWLLGPEGNVSLFPILASRSNFVSAAGPVLLPDNNPSGAHPRLRLTEPGPHELWCGLSRKPVVDRLPAELRPGQESKASSAALREAFVKAAGSSFIADGAAPFTVVALQAAR